MDPTSINTTAQPATGTELVFNHQEEPITTKSSLHDDAPPVPDPNTQVPKSAYILGLTCALSGLVFGFDIGGSGGTFVMDSFAAHLGWVKDPITDEFLPWVSNQQGWIASLMSLGSLIGALPSGWLADHIGRRTVLLGANVVFILGAILQIWTMNVEMLYAGRLISGVGIGALTCLTGVYVGEVAPAQVRGLLMTLFQLNITFGILLAGAMNIGLTHWDEGWRISYGGNAFFSILMIIGLIFLPESPRYMYTKGKVEECEATLRKYRSTEEEVTYEMWTIKEQENNNGEGVATWCELFQSKNRQGYRTFLGMSLQFFQQWCGINAIMQFAPTMIQTFASDTAALYGNLSIQFVNFVATFIAVFFVEKIGRVPLFVTGGFGMAIALFTVSMLTAPFSAYETTTSIAVAVVFMMIVYVFFFSYSWGPLAWVVCSEIHGIRARGKGVSLSTATGNISAFIVGRVTPVLLRPNVLNLWGVYLLFCCFASMMSAWVWFMVPETANVKLEELDDLFLEFKIGSIKRTKWIPPSQRGHEEKEV